MAANTVSTIKRIDCLLVWRVSQGERYQCCILHNECADAVLHTHDGPAEPRQAQQRIVIHALNVSAQCCRHWIPGLFILWIKYLVPAFIFIGPLIQFFWQ